MKTDLENSGMIDIRGLLREMKRREENARFERVFSVSQVLRRREPLRLESAVLLGDVPRLRPGKRRWLVVGAAVILASLGGNAFALTQKMVSYQQDRDVEVVASLASQRAEVSRVRSAARRGHSSTPLPMASTVAPPTAGADALVASQSVAKGAAHQRKDLTQNIANNKHVDRSSLSGERIEHSPEPFPMVAPQASPPSTLSKGPPLDLDAAIRASVGPSALRDAPGVGPSNSKDYEVQARQLRPSAGAIMAAVGGAQSGARRCLAGGDEPRTCKITFRSDGSVARVSATRPSLGGDAASACIEAAFARAHTDAFADASYTATVVVRP